MGVELPPMQYKDDEDDEEEKILDALDTSE